MATVGDPKRDDAYPGSMAFDEGLAERVRELIADQSDISERKMFGGLCFCAAATCVSGLSGVSSWFGWVQPRTRPRSRCPKHREMDFTGRSMRGMVYVGEAGLSEDDDLSGWLDRGLEFARSLPAK